MRPLLCRVCLCVQTLCLPPCTASTYTVRWAMEEDEAVVKAFPLRGRELPCPDTLGQLSFSCQVLHKSRSGKVSRGGGKTTTVCCLSQLCGLWYELIKRFPQQPDACADVCILAGNTLSSSADWTEFEEFLQGSLLMPFGHFIFVPGRNEEHLFNSEQQIQEAKALLEKNQCMERFTLLTSLDPAENSIYINGVCFSAVLQSRSAHRTGRFSVSSNEEMASLCVS